MIYTWHKTWPLTITTLGKGDYMIKAKLVALLNGSTKLDAVVNINNNESMVSFEVDELSQESQDKILAVLNDHFDNLGIAELANKILINY